MTTDRTPTFDFDPHTPHYRDNWEDIARQFHTMDFPMAWSPHYDGFWVLADWENAKRVLEDHETFSSDNDLQNEREGFRGVGIPRQPYQLMLSESDPPLSTARRRLEVPFFTPKSLRDWGPKAHGFLNEALAGCAGREVVDLVHDIIIPTTARTTLNLVGFEADNWRDAAMSSHRSAYMKYDDPDYPHAEMARTREMFHVYIAERRANPREDILTALAHGTVNGLPLTDFECESMLSALVFGGFDTTTSAATNALVWLSDKPDQRDRMRASPESLRLGMEELLRFYPPVPGLARNARRDIEIGGRLVRKGDRIWCWLAGANRDPKKFPSPDTIDLARANAADHISFSSGTHRCLGAPLAKLELIAMYEAFLNEFPDFRIELDRLEKFPLIGAVLGYLKVPVRLGQRA